VCDKSFGSDSGPRNTRCVQLFNKNYFRKLVIRNRVYSDRSCNVNRKTNIFPIYIYYVKYNASIFKRRRLFLSKFSEAHSHRGEEKMNILEELHSGRIRLMLIHELVLNALAF